MAVVAEGAKEPVDLEDDEDDDDDDDEAEVAFAVLLEQGMGGGSRSKQGFELHLSWLNVWLS